MSGLKLITAAATFPITLDEGKAHLRVDFTDDDDLITAMIAAATGYAEKFQGRALIDQTWDYYVDHFPSGSTWHWHTQHHHHSVGARHHNVIKIPKPPLIDVVGLFYQDSDSVEQEFTDFEIDVASAPGRVFLANGISWPSPATVLNAVRIRFRAGYLDSSSPPVADVPDTTKAAIKLILGTLYAQRETLSAGVTVTEVPWSAHELLRQERVEVSMA